jgi:MHS family shikimate/dehydroshikimate transporter-like MFS transporter
VQASGEQAPVQGASIRRVALATLLGTAIEWYDYFIYGTAAALVFNQLFFPNFSPLAGTLASFATFAVGFVARPVGGIVIGHYGDKIGRKAMLVLTLVMMGLATFLLGLLPTYETIGVWAPILLVALRLMQGFAVGGEWGGAVLMAVEHSPRDKRGFYGSWPQMGSPAGLLLATGVFSLFSMLPSDQFLAWGWRAPFLLSIVLVGVGLYIRLSVMESPAFSQVKESGTEARMPVVDVFRTHPKNVFLAMGMRIADNGFFYMFAVFSLAYATEQLGLPRSTILNSVLIAAAVYLVTIPAYGALSDKIGRRPLYMAGAASLALFSFPFFWLLNTKNEFLIVLALVLGFAAFHAAMYGPQAAFFSELFGTRVRYSGVALGYNLATLVAGGPAPFIATALLAWSAGAFWPVAVYMMVMACITLVSVYLATENREDDIVPSGLQVCGDAAHLKPLAEKGSTKSGGNA